MRSISPLRDRKPVWNCPGLRLPACLLAVLLLLTATAFAMGNESDRAAEPEAKRSSEPPEPESFVAPSSPQPSASGATADKWQVAITPYLFLARMDGDVALGGLESDVNVSARTLLDNLEFAAASRFEVRKGPWAGLFDVNFMALGAQGDLPLGGRLDVDIDMLTFESALAYRLGSADTGVDVLGGVRYVRQDLRASRTGGIGSGAQRKFTPDWVDPIFGVRFTKQISPRASFIARGDIGGFGAGSDFTWNVEAGAEFRFTRHLGVQILFKALGIDYEEGSGADFYKYDIVSPGVVFGFPIRF